MNKWKLDFENALARLDDPYLNAIQPRIVLMPDWWPIKVDAWSYLNVVMIGPGILDAPDTVRQYVIGHELGHLYAKHTLIHIFYWLGAVGAIAGLLLPHPYLFAVSFLVMSFSAFSVLFRPFIRRRELHADSIAAELFGREVALSGCLWMATRSGTLRDPFRQSRLRHLGAIDNSPPPIR